jgi:Ser/Thr protein kinase RdoA (MazF antagonist)
LAVDFRDIADPPLAHESREALSLARSPAVAHSRDHPTREDADRSVQLVEELVSGRHATLFARALEVVRSATRKLAEAPSAFDLIHGDLHHENFLFHRGEAYAIDFDDCGWGLHLYDVAVTLSELEARPRYVELRDALLEAYAQKRPLPVNHATHLEALFPFAPDADAAVDPRVPRACGLPEHVAHVGPRGAG